MALSVLCNVSMRDWGISASRVVWSLTLKDFAARDQAWLSLIRSGNEVCGFEHQYDGWQGKNGVGGSGTRKMVIGE